MKRRVRIIIVIVLMLAVIGFIWGNSIFSKASSRQESLSVMNFLRPFLEPLVGKERYTLVFVRKLAHCTEFGALGVLFAVLAYAVEAKGRQAVLNCLFAALGVAVVDEAIQILSRRGSQVQDVLLDFAAAALGIAIVRVIGYFIRKIRANKH
ncbi:MAG: VanZ family protein [Oscillospiraceae bacterium]|nr:VanZ family protein [Oscillospiraceae bacterium]